MWIVDTIPLPPVEQMQKLLVLLLNPLKHYFLSQYDVSKALPIFLRAMALVLFVAVSSIVYQFDDLVMIDQVFDSYANHRASLFLNVFQWLPASFCEPLLWLCLIFSGLLFFLILPFWMLLFNAVIYSSLLVYFPTFLSFQWDILLIEALLLSLLLVSPKCVRLHRRGPMIISYFQLLPLVLLMVRLFYHSAVVKLLSKDPLWLGQQVMDIHLFSQPLPHFLSYYFHSFIIFNNVSPFITQLMFVIELVLPFGLLFHSYRKISAGILILFQLMIIGSGNYGYFNFLVMAILLLPLLLKSWDPLYDLKSNKKPIKFLLIPLLIILIINSVLIISHPKAKAPLFTDVFRRLRVFNGFGLFARMTTNQTKFNVRLSHDGQSWDPLKLKYFDDDGYPELLFVQPYHPRIRWQLWFKFIYELQYPKWYLKFIKTVAKDPNLLPSIVKRNQNLDSNYSYVELCYQDIVFNLNDPLAPHNYWMPLYKKKCHIYDVKRGGVYR